MLSKGQAQEEGKTPWPCCFEPCPSYTKGDIKQEKKKAYHHPRDNIDYLIRGVRLQFRLIDCLYSLPQTVYWLKVRWERDFQDANPLSSQMAGSLHKTQLKDSILSIGLYDRQYRSLTKSLKSTSLGDFQNAAPCYELQSTCCILKFLHSFLLFN